MDVKVVEFIDQNKSIIKECLLNYLPRTGEFLNLNSVFYKVIAVEHDLEEKHKSTLIVIKTNRMMQKLSLIKQF